MKPRILIVDDEPNVLAAYQRVLHHLYESVPATSAAAALELLAKDKSFAVIVSDMRMPGVSGLTLLKHVQRFAPDVVRIMLTGSDDQKTTIDAVNSGHVFRFLRKPCPGHVFLAAVQEAVEHHQIGKKERELLEKTFTGVVDMLTDMLAAADPVSGHRAQRLRDRAVEVARALDHQPTWEIESAALLLRIGTITLPSHILFKLREDQQLLASEQMLVNRIPEIGAKLLENIPRLAPVAAIVRNHRRGFDGSGEPANGPTGVEIPVGARIIRPLLDLQELQQQGVTMEDALETLRHNVQAYDPDVLRSLEHLRPDDDDSTEHGEYRMAQELRTGMKLASDALSDTGLPLVMTGTKLTGFLIARLHNFSELGQLREPLFVIPRKVEEAQIATAPRVPTLAPDDSPVSSSSK